MSERAAWVSIHMPRQIGWFRDPDWPPTWFGVFFPCDSLGRALLKGNVTGRTANPRRTPCSYGRPCFPRSTRSKNSLEATLRLKPRVFPGRPKRPRSPNVRYYAVSIISRYRQGLMQESNHIEAVKPVRNSSKSLEVFEALRLAILSRKPARRSESLVALLSNDRAAVGYDSSRGGS